MDPLPKHLNIGLDLDEVVGEFLDSLILYHNAVYGTTLHRDQFSTYDFEDVLHCTRDEAVRKLREFERTPIFEDLALVPGAYIGIRTIKKEDHNLYVITGRNEELVRPTYTWLNRHFPYTFADVRFTNHYRGNGQRAKKSDICKALNIHVLAEDYLEHAIDCAEQHIPVLLLNRPWNQAPTLPSGVTRVYSFDEIVDHILHRKFQSIS